LVGHGSGVLGAKNANPFREGFPGTNNLFIKSQMFELQFKILEYANEVKN
jgi:hypothetical protein